MNIVKCQKQDLLSIFDIISKCKTHMESHNIYQWNEFYPSLDIIETDIISGNCYLLKDNGLSIAYFAIDEEQPSEYNNINWITQGEKVLVIHRLGVLPEYQGRGIAKKILKFIEEFADENKYTSIRLDAYSENKKALKLYGNYGYKRVDKLYFPNRVFHFYCYEKKLKNTPIPEILIPMLNEYDKSLRENFPNKIFGIYIYNSVALGCFNEKTSDIDFITIINEEFENEDICTVEKVHKKISEAFEYGNRLEGMYITKEKVGKLNSEINPYIYFCDNILHYYGYYDINYITWWTLKYFGIPINCSDVNSLSIEVDWCSIIENMNYNLNNYWKDKLSENNIFLQDEWIEFAVATLCRILYTLENKAITSKDKALEYAITTIPKEYSLIIKECLRLRKRNSDSSFYRSTFEREHSVKSFIKFIIDICNEKYKLQERNYIKCKI